MSTTDNIDIDKAILALDRAHGIVDTLYTLQCNCTDGLNALSKGTLTSQLDCAMESIAEAREAIFPTDKISEVTA